MLEWIPKALRPDLSPLLVKAATWPDARSLTQVAAAPSESGAPDEPALDPAQKDSLDNALALIHPELRARVRYYLTAKAELYARFSPAKDAPTDATHAAWTGWGSWAPCAGPVRAFAAYASAGEPRGGATAEVLISLLGDLLTPDLGAEVAACRLSPAPAAAGPDHFAATFRLDPAGYGMAYGYVYAYTNGQRVVVAIQPQVHFSL